MNNICKIPLFNELNSTYTGAIFHKNYFLFLNPCQCEVVVFDHYLKKVGCIDSQPYQSITDNRKDCYFVLTKVDDKDFLYKSTYDFLEFDCIKLNVPSKYKGRINDIHYDEELCRIYITTDLYVYSVTTDGYFIKEEGCISRNSTKVMSNSNICCGMLKVPEKSQCLYTAVSKCDVPYVSYIKNNEAILSTLNGCECNDKICLGEDIRVVSIFVSRNRLFLLVIKCGKYNYLYELDIDCGCDNEHYCCDNRVSNDANYLDNKYYGCDNYYQNDKKHCDNKCFENDKFCLGDRHCCDDKHCCDNHCHHCQDPVACILESIALEQTALSHILNAEGEKIQKAIADDADLCGLLEINKSVTDTIFNATMMEHVLQEKISKVLQYDDKR